MFDAEHRDRRPRESGERSEDAAADQSAGGRPAVSPQTTPQWASGASGAGRPLTAEVREEMEAALRHDLGDVRIHDGAAAQAVTRELDADAVTVGADIAFAPGRYAPDSPRGRQVLAHELSHVVQAGPAAPAGVGDAGSRVSRRDSPAEREAGRVAAHVSGQGGPGPAPRPTPGLAPRGTAHCFDSFEHIQLGDTARGGPVRGGPPSSYSTGYILLDCHARDLPQHATPTIGWPADWVTRYARGTPEQRRAITEGLTYGEIIAFSGDMYAAVDPATNATSVVGTMERINRASLVEIYDLIPLLRSRSASTGDLEEATGGRYISLAQHNVSHFSNVSGGRNNLSTWRDGHRAALRIAASGNANAAWAMNAAADHFLTDAFASGHMRPDRATGVLSRTGQIGSKVLHDLDNDFGVAVHNRRGDRWIAYGDDRLNDAAHARGLAIAREAVEYSKADIQAALNAASAGSPAPATGAPGAFVSEDLVPVVDVWSANRWSPADQVDEIGHLASTELPEQVVPNGDTRAREWVSRQPVAALTEVPFEEKVRMINRMLQGWVSDDDLTGIERLYRASRPGDQVALRRVIAPQVHDLVSPRQRAWLQSIISSP